MFLKPREHTATGPENWFTGTVYVEPLAAPVDDDQRMLVSRVRFTPGAHTAWHAHGRGQTLHITAGTALIGTRDGTIIRATPGQTVYTPPGEEHWHGATTDTFMEHLAMLETADGSEAEDGWYEHVSDDDYRAANSHNSKTEA